MRRRDLWSVMAAVPFTLGLALLVTVRPARTTEHAGHPGASGHAAMTDAQMQRWAESWWATHPRVGAASSGAPAATFTVANFRFDSDGNTETQVDSVTIVAGQTVLWQWIIGIHSITNGVESGDADAGTLFDQPSNSGSPQFSFAFANPGRYPFFCRPHEGDVMRGVVVVLDPTGVEPTTPTLGFTAGPAPTPSRGGVTFAFAMREPGRATAEVFDPSGRRVAIVLDRHLDAGPHTGAWDGRMLSGAPAEAGLYYLRLRLPGHAESRPIVITR